MQRLNDREIDEVLSEIPRDGLAVLGLPLRVRKELYDFQHRSQDSRQSLAEQIEDQYRRQIEAERSLEREETQRQTSFSNNCS